MKVLVLAVLVYLTTVNGQSDLCGFLKCPEFEVVMKTKNYEKRCYPSYNWTTTDATVEFVKPFQKVDNRLKDETFHPLRNYRLGANQDGVKFDQTVPVIKNYMFLPHDETTTFLHFTRLFFLPPNLQQNPPQPVDPKVKIENWPRTCFYVRQYKGPHLWNKVVQEVRKLKRSLVKDGVNDFKDPHKQFLYAGYEIEKVRKYNEIWFPLNWKVVSLSLAHDQ